MHVSKLLHMIVDALLDKDLQVTLGHDATGRYRVIIDVDV